MQTEQSALVRGQSNLSFFGQWLVANLLGLLVGGMLAIPIGFGLGDVAIKSLGELAGGIVTSLLFGVILGGVLGGAQALALRDQIERPYRWAAASVIGGVLGFMLPLTLFFVSGTMETADDTVVAITLGFSYGLLVGIAQWFVLRERTPKAGWWIAISALAMVLAMVTVFNLDGEGREVLALSAGGLVLGIVSGAGMTWLLRE